MKAPRAILAIDPGLTTGIAVVTADGTDLELVESDELDVMATGYRVRDLLWDLYQEHGDDFAVVIERFTITAATAKNSQAPWSLKVIGMVEWLVHDAAGLPPEGVITFQGPAEAKKLITNDILKKHGLWHVGGAGHANDAIRHAVYRYAVLGWRKPWDKQM